MNTSVVEQLGNSSLLSHTRRHVASPYATRTIFAASPNKKKEKRNEKEQQVETRWFLEKVRCETPRLAGIEEMQNRGAQARAGGTDKNLP